MRYSYKHILSIIPILFASCHFQPGGYKLSGVAKLPSFKILSIDSSLCINSDNMTTGCPVIFIYFSPNCDHCKKETEDILNHISEFKHTKIFWITNDPIDEVKKFNTNFRLDTIKNLFLGKDFNYSFYRAYLPSDIPYIAIYNSKNKLVKIYKGATDINSLIESVQD